MYGGPIPFLSSLTRGYLLFVDWTPSGLDRSAYSISSFDRTDSNLLLHEAPRARLLKRKADIYGVLCLPYCANADDPRLVESISQ